MKWWSRGPGDVRPWDPAVSFSLAAPDFDKSQWLDVKFKLDLDFPNVGGLGEGGPRGRRLPGPSLLPSLAWGHLQQGLFTWRE